MSSELPLVRDLTENERQWCDDGRAMAVSLFQRYAFALPDGDTPRRMDAVYAAWCEDSRDDLPALQSIYQGFGILLGDLFREYFDYEWKMVKDEFGSEISLYIQSPTSSLQNAWLSPLSMVAKRVRDGYPFFASLLSTIVYEHERDGYRKRVVTSRHA